MKKEGKKFEEDFKKSCQKFLFYRFPDSNKFANFQDNNSFRFTLKSPCDCFIFYYPNIFFLELKSTISTSFSHQMNRCWEKSTKSFDIKPHQIDNLLQFSKNEGVVAGLILNFRERATKTTYRPNTTYFIEINKFIEYTQRYKERGSINEFFANKLGMKIIGNRKRIRYIYDVEDCLNKIKSNIS